MKTGSRNELLILSTAVIALATLLPGNGGASDGCILCGHRALSDFLSNIVLFAPFGFGLALRRQSLLSTALAGALFSLAIEVAQLSLISGRDANISDLIANSLGAVAGWGLGDRRHWWMRAGRNHRCLTITAATLALLLMGLGLFTPSLPATTYYMQWTPRFEHMGVYKGKVLSTRIGPLEMAGGQRITQTDSVRRMLFKKPLQISATADLGAEMAPIISIYDADQRQILLLGAERSDLTYRYRMLADELRLDHGDLRIHQAFEHITHGRTYRLKWAVDRAGYCLELEDQRRCGPGFTVGDTWTLLRSLDWGTDERTVISAVWLWLMFIPAGLVSTGVRTTAKAGALMGITLILIPLFMGFALTPAYQIIASWIGLLTGWLTGARSIERYPALESGELPRRAMRRA